jgi:hypothetical protein
MLNNFGEDMDSCEELHATDNRSSTDSLLEVEGRLNSLTSLVCDLLKTNQELRVALLEAMSSVPKTQGS